MESPAVTYSRLLLETQARQARGRNWERSLGYAKVAVFLGGAVAAVLLLRSPSFLGLLLIPIVLFIVLAIAHERVLRWLQHRQRVAEFYERGLARLEDRWAGTGETGDRFLDPVHPYARDLDLFGHGSLFELLCTARTRAGEETLAAWLSHAAPPDEVRQRQVAISEMKDRLPFRGRLFAAGESVRLGVYPEALAAWGERAPVFRARWLPAALALLAALWIAAVAFWIVGTLGYATIGNWFSGLAWHLLLLLSLINFAINYGLRRRVAASANAVEQATGDLRLLAEVLQVIEQERFSAERLRSLRTALDTRHLAPSTAVKRLGQIADWLEGHQNIFVALFNHFVFYAALLAMAAEHWQKRFGPAIRGWLSAVGEFEALAALAGYAFEHPDDVLPELVETQACFEAVGLAHPLLPASRAVGNDLALGNPVQLIVISGPNMAGKSTFLRGVGLNAVLAQCGAPVRAQRLRLSPLAVGASICVLDSLQGGVSRFYAEIRRLKLLSDLADGPVPLLFLLDELLSGTNSHDRLEGTRFVVQALVRRGAIGLVTTHDLALAGIPETMDGAARNCHFEDSIEDDELRFDYRLKPGIVRTSNALKLMKAVGLEVGD